MPWSRNTRPEHGLEGPAQQQVGRTGLPTPPRPAPATAPPPARCLGRRPQAARCTPAPSACRVSLPSSILGEAAIGHGGAEEIERRVAEKLEALVVLDRIGVLVDVGAVRQRATAAGQDRERSTRPSGQSPRVTRSSSPTNLGDAATQSCCVVRVPSGSPDGIDRISDPRTAERPARRYARRSRRRCSAPRATLACPGDIGHIVEVALRIGRAQLMVGGIRPLRRPAGTDRLQRAGRAHHVTRHRLGGPDGDAVGRRHRRRP